MPSRSPSWAMAHTLCLMMLVWICLLQPALAAAQSMQHEEVIARQAPPPPSTNNGTGTHLLCSPFGACEPCPPDAMNEPFCQPFGNRRLMHCTNTTFVPAPAPGQSTESNATPPSHLTTLHPAGEVLAWESCGRIVAKERGDFYEFVACNVVFALIALGVLFFRSRRMQVNQARQLAARIGLIRGEGGRVMRQ
ncbi:hypothetical protein BJ912DRAFT_903663 [Pholiota molesta]|nr:hypothetical protein BJ912DRAFT_903663 [Pholiota molesta]